jgi:hypothetical protein
MLAKNLLSTAGNALEANYIEDVFSTYLYKGNGSSQTITNDIDLAGKGGLVWIKDRTVAQANNLVDTVRGAGNYLTSNTTDTNTYTLQNVGAFTGSGFTVGDGVNSQGLVNSLNDAYASWTFRKQPKFFDVVTYTGNGAYRNITHSLGANVGFLLIKRTDATGNWLAFHRDLSSTGNMLELNTTSSQQINTVLSEAPSTHFTIGAGGTSNALANVNGATYVAYLFAHNAGGFGLTGTDNVISCSSYTGTSTVGNEINVGFEPQFVIIKRATGIAENWVMFDNMRGIATGGNDAILNPSGAFAEYGSSNYIGLTSTGFKIEGSGLNVSGDKYIYIAIRKGPMKVPTDATKVFNSVSRIGTDNDNTVVDVGLAPDMLLSGLRAGNYSYSICDKLRGVSKSLFSPSNTGAEDTDTTYGSVAVKSMTNTGVIFGTDTGVARYNFNHGSPFIQHFFKRAPGFFDEVCYTGTGASSITVQHNLTVSPELIITKCRSASGNWWMVYSATLGANKYLSIANNGTNPAANGAVYPTVPTASNFYVNGTFTDVGGAGLTYASYLFATCPGVSKVGSYTGNGTSQTIGCGFTGGARFILIKRTDSTGDWYVWDTARGIVSGNDPYLRLNSTAGEVTTNDSVDPASTGFIVNQLAATDINVTSASYIFLAIA